MHTRLILSNNFFSFLSLLIIFLTVTNCGKTVKKKEKLSAQELKTTVASLLREKNYEEASECLEQIIMKHPDDPAIGRCRLSLANCLFKLEKYPAAVELYEYYHEHYPADKHAEYAKYRAILAQYKQTLSHDRDQSATIDTMQRCSEYQYNLLYKKYRNDVEAIHQSCLTKLLEKEIYVYNFYLNQGKTKAAEKRLAYIKENYLNKDTSLEPQLLYLEYKLAHKQNDQTLMQKTLNGLSSKYPESPFVSMAEALEAPKKFFF